MRASRWLVLVAGLATWTILAPAEVQAQRRAVRRPATGPAVGTAVPRPYYRGSYARPYHYRPYYYRPYYYAPYYGHYGYWPYYGYGPSVAFGLSFGWYGGYGGYGWSPYGYYGAPYPSPYGGGYYYLSEARIQVQPRHAEVFIDGYFVGTVDEFDGWAQRLRLEPGEHELEIFLDGYRTYRQKVLFRPASTLRVEHVLQPLGPGEQPGTRPTPSQGTVQPPARGYPAPAPQRELPSQPRPSEPQEFGAIAIRVQPSDAEVIVDGERWESPAAGDLTLQLTEGTHRVEIRREGYRSYSADIRVRRGETTSLNVSLSRQQGAPVTSRPPAPSSQRDRFGGSVRRTGQSG
jgi:hypothetical protein